MKESKDFRMCMYTLAFRVKLDYLERCHLNSQQVSGKLWVKLSLTSVIYGFLYHIKSLGLLSSSYGSYASVETYYLTVIRRGAWFGFPVFGVDEYSPSPGSRVGQNIFPLGEAMYALLIRFLKMDLDLLYFIFSVIFTSLIFLVISCLVMCGGASVNVSMLSSGLIILFTFQGDYSLQRPISPQFNYLVWLFGLLLIFRLFLSGKDLLWVAFFCGVALYISSPYQAIHLVLCFFTTVLFLWFRNIITPQRLLVSLLISSIIALPLLLDVLQKLSDDSWSDYLLRMGIIRSHLPSTAETVIFSLLSLLILLLVKMKYKLFLPSLLYTTILIALSNSNILTGRTLQTYHFEEMGKFVFSLSFVTLLHLRFLPWLKNKFSIETRFPLRFTLISFILLVSLQVAQLESKIRQVPVDGVIFEVNEALSELPKGSRVLIEPFDTFDYERFHDVNFIFAKGTSGFPIPTNELAERYYLANKCNSLSREELLLREHSIFIYALLGESQKNEAWRRHLGHFGLQNLVAEPRKDYRYLDRFMNEYRRAVDFGCVSLLDKYNVEYLILAESPTSIDWVKRLRLETGLKLVSSSSLIKIYQFQKGRILR